MSLVEKTIVSVFVLWFLATAFYQLFITRLMKYTRRWDIFRLIPAFSLFARTPRDFRLFYRDCNQTGVLTGWKEIPLFHKRQWHHFIWNPRYFVISVITSSVDEMVSVLERKSQKGKKMSERFIYQTILRYVLRFPKSEENISRQFKIEEAFGFITTEEAKELFVSEYHAL